MKSEMLGAARKDSIVLAYLPPPVAMEAKSMPTNKLSFVIVPSQTEFQGGQALEWYGFCWLPHARLNSFPAGGPVVYFW